MQFTPDLIAEMELLLEFDISTAQAGIKIHKTATAEVKAAASRLFEKKIISQEDGGYLTTIGMTSAEHAQSLHMLLKPSVST